MKDDGYPDVQAFMTTYRKAEAVVDNYNRELAEWERHVKERTETNRKQNGMYRPKRQSVRNRLKQFQTEGRRTKIRKEPKSQDRDR